MYQRLLGEVSDLRQGNRRRIRKGLWALVGVTVGLLALVFISQSSKVIFLLLWIVSMFGVAAYLIGVEYMDYQMQHKVGHIANMREGELSEILTLPESSPKSRLAARLRREADVLEGVETPPEPEESIPAVFDLPRSLVDLEPLEDPEPEQPEPEPVPAVPEKKSEASTTYYRGKKQRAEDAKRRKRLDTLEKEIAADEEEIQRLTEFMAGEEAASDYEKLTEAANRMEELQQGLTAKYEEWSELSE